MKLTIESFELYPAGIYPVTVEEITLDANEKYGKQIRFKFKLGGELQGKTLTGWCKHSGSVKSKYYEWFCALTNTKPQAGEDTDTDLLIGRSATAVIKVGNKEDGTPKNVIDSLLPLQKTAPSTNGHTAQPPTLFASIEAAMQYCADMNLYIDKPAFITALKATGATGWLPKRDSAWVINALVPQLVEAQTATGQEVPF